MKRWTYLPLAALLLAAACNDEDKPGVTPATPDAAPATPDAGAPVTPDAAPPLVPLTDWVHDLVIGFGPMSAPDTVDDKHIMDTDDPSAFDSLLQ